MHYGEGGGRWYCCVESDNVNIQSQTEKNSSRLLAYLTNQWLTALVTAPPVSSQVI